VTASNDAEIAAWQAEYSAALESKRPEAHPRSAGEPLTQRSTQNAPAPPEGLSGEFRFIGHRTTRFGRVALDFTHEDTGQICTRFFNVDIKKYPAGENGQFTTKKRSLFRQFWLQVIGEPPRRWCRVYWEMHRLKKVNFKALATYKPTADGGYWSITKIRKQ